MAIVSKNKFGDNEPGATRTDAHSAERDDLQSGVGLGVVFNHPSTVSDRAAASAPGLPSALQADIVHLIKELADLTPAEVAAKLRGLDPKLLELLKDQEQMNALFFSIKAGSWSAEHDEFKAQHEKILNCFATQLIESSEAANSTDLLSSGRDKFANSKLQGSTIESAKLAQSNAMNIVEDKANVIEAKQRNDASFDLNNLRGIVERPFDHAISDQAAAGGRVDDKRRSAEHQIALQEAASFLRAPESHHAQGNNSGTGTMPIGGVVVGTLGGVASGVAGILRDGVSGTINLLRGGNCEPMCLDDPSQARRDLDARYSGLALNDREGAAELGRSCVSDRFTEAKNAAHLSMRELELQFPDATAFLRGCGQDEISSDTAKLDHFKSLIEKGGGTRHYDSLIDKASVDQEKMLKVGYEAASVVDKSRNPSGLDEIIHDLNESRSGMTPLVKLKKGWDDKETLAPAGDTDHKQHGSGRDIHNKLDEKEQKRLDKMMEKLIEVFSNLLQKVGLKKATAPG